MIPEADEFLSLISSSGLLNQESIAHLRADRGDGDSKMLADRLVQEKRITRLHRDVLLAGHDGPFFFGRYRIERTVDFQREQTEADPADLRAGGRDDLTLWGPAWRSYAARDTRTGHPVLLNFFAGESSQDLQRWRSIETQCDQFAGIDSAYVLRTFQSIVLPSYRFVATEIPTGKSLIDLLPSKTKLKQPQAIVIAAQVCSAARAALNCDIVPDFSEDCLMRRIWVEKNSLTKWLPQFETPTQNFDPTAAERNSVLGLSALLSRLLTGRWLIQPAVAGSQANDKQPNRFTWDLGELTNRLQKSELHQSVKELILAGIPDGHQAQISLADFQSKLLTELDGELPKPVPLKTLPAFEATITSAQIDSGSEVVFEVPEINPLRHPAATESATAATDLSNSLASQASQKRKRSRGRHQLAAAMSLATLGLISFLLMVITQSDLSDPLAQVDPEVKSTPDASALSPEIPSETDSPNPKSAPDPVPIAPTDTAPTEIDLAQVGYVQDVVDDDHTRSRLWESPTTGQPLELSFLPNSPEIIFHGQPQAIFAAGEGDRLIASFGPAAVQQLDQLKDRAGIPLEQMKSLTVSLHRQQDGQPGYAYFFQVTVADATIAREQLIANWQDADEIETPNGIIFANSDTGYYFVGADNADELRFIFGNPAGVQQVVNQSGSTATSAIMRRLIEKTDRDRHVQLLAVSNSLLNENGRALLGEWNELLSPPLKQLIPDDVRGIVMGWHLAADGGEYLELRLEQTFDIRPEELSDKLFRKIKQLTVAVSEFSKQLATADYWDRVQQRFPAMLSAVSANVRVGVEFNQVVANLWLPPHGAQNLIAASELTITFSGSLQEDRVAAAGTSNRPRSLEALLQLPRTLVVDNPPDLNVLLNQLVAEIKDDYPELADRLDLKFAGNDLKAEGITQNQRPGPLAIRNQPLTSILTEIITSANPNKNITGPADPECKLVWVVTQNPEDLKKQTILITTRSAAEKNNYSLPAAFVEK